MTHDPNTRYGYFYHSGDHQLDVCIADQPTRQHFDPVEMRLPMRSVNGIEYIYIRHRWHGEDTLTVGVGRIILRDWRVKVVEAFSFGGTLSIETSPLCTCGTLTSDAPILAIESASLARLDTHFETQLAERTEGLIARARAAAGQQFAAFDAHLASLPPHELYGATLAALEAELDHAHTATHEQTLHFRHYLHELRHQLTDLQHTVDPYSIFPIG